MKVQNIHQMNAEAISDNHPLSNLSITHAVSNYLIIFMAYYKLQQTLHN